jgi:hypothetical protein
MSVRAGVEIRTDGIGLNSPIALDDNGIDRLRVRRRRTKRHDVRAQKSAPEDKAQDAQASTNQPTKTHSPMRPFSSP